VSESWEAITIVDIAEITATLAASRVDDVSSITAFVDFSTLDRLWVIHEDLCGGLDPPQSDLQPGALRPGGCPTKVEAVGLLGLRGHVQSVGRAGDRGHPDCLGCADGCLFLEG
jgi:hypothetical protein